MDPETTSKWLYLAGNSNGLGYDVHVSIYLGNTLKLMSLNLRFEISPDVISTEAPLEETLLMNTRTLAYYGLDPLGSKLWQFMQTCQDADEIIRQAVTTTGKSQEELEQLMRAILSGMTQSRLLSVTRTDVAIDPAGV